MSKSSVKLRESDAGIAEIIFDYNQSEKSTEDEQPVIDIKLEAVDSDEPEDICNGSVAAEKSQLEEQVVPRPPISVSQDCVKPYRRKRIAKRSFPFESSPPPHIEQKTKRPRKSRVSPSPPSESCIAQKKNTPRKSRVNQAIPSESRFEQKKRSPRKSRNAPSIFSQSYIVQKKKKSPRKSRVSPSPPSESRIEQKKKSPRKSRVNLSIPSESLHSPPAATPTSLRVEELLTKISDSEDICNGSVVSEESLIEEQIEETSVLTEECAIPFTPSSACPKWVKPYQRLVKRTSRVATIPSETPAAELPLPQISEAGDIFNGSAVTEESLIEVKVEATSVLTEECVTPIMPTTDSQDSMKPNQRLPSESPSSSPAAELPLPSNELALTKSIPPPRDDSSSAKSCVFYCHNCDFATNCRDELQDHVVQHLPHQRQHRCKLCPYKCWTKKYLKVHFKLHDGERMAELVDHERTHQKKLFECNLCPFRSKSAQYLKKHLKCHINPENFKCTECSYSTFQSRALKKHMMIHNGGKNHACTQCTFRTNRISTLRDHMKYKHENIKKRKCPHCKYRTGHKGNMKSHIRTHTDERPYECAECPFKARTSKVLENHRMNHTGERRFACDQCEYRSVQEGPMIHHVNSVHFRLAPFECHHCKYRTTRLYVLKKHIDNHFGLLVKTACGYPGCSYSTADQTSLKEHKRIHTGEKPYACPKCTYRSRTARLLKRHLTLNIHVTEHGAIQYHCKDCDFYSSRASSLREHELLTHLE